MTQPTPWQPGHRRRPASIRPTSRLSQSVIARGMMESYIVHVMNEPNLMGYMEDGSPPEEGPNIQLNIQRSGGKYVRVLLDRMTVEELNAFKQMVDFALEQALAVAEHRDHVAQEAMDNGDYSYTRGTRPTPVVNVFKRPGTEFAQELHGRREADVPRDADPGTGDERTGTDGGEVADNEQVDKVSGNDSSSAGSSAPAWPVPRFGPSA